MGVHGLAWEECQARPVEAQGDPQLQPHLQDQITVLIISTINSMLISSNSSMQQLGQHGSKPSSSNSSSPRSATAFVCQHRTVVALNLPEFSREKNDLYRVDKANQFMKRGLFKTVAMI